ncbi:MAG: hypothetical protein BWY61_00427 [Firmicutes bacterium ADurb.Bin354]|nr:MAG: hypothetical protein BWY61_00427 [Firmicutes bacterium ADurb.Bin354]
MRILRLFLKLCDLAVFIRDDDTETLSLFDGNRHNGDGNLSLILLMEVKHDFVVHLIDMVSRKYQYILGIKALHIIKILIYGICRTRIPFTVYALLVRRKYSHTTDITVKIPGDTYADMRVQPEWLILCKNAHGIDSRIDAVTQRKIDDPVFSAKRNRRLCHLSGKHAQSASLAPRQKHRYHLFLYHVITSSCKIKSSNLMSEL